MALLQLRVSHSSHSVQIPRGDHVKISSGMGSRKTGGRLDGSRTLNVTSWPPLHLQGPDVLTTSNASARAAQLSASSRKLVADGRTPVHHVMCSPEHWPTMNPTLHVRNFQCVAATVPWESCLPEGIVDWCGIGPSGSTVVGRTG